MRTQVENRLRPHFFSSPKLIRNSMLTLIASMVAAPVGFFATPYMGVATFSYCLINLGLLNRRTKITHAWYMNTAIGLDLALVLILEVQRHAVNTALSFTLSPLQQAHIVMSSVATCLYIPILILGWIALLGKLGRSGRKWHMRLGFTAYAFRTLGFVLMFALLGHKS